MRDATKALLPPPNQRPKRDEQRVRAAGVLETFANHPDLGKAFFEFNRHVLWGTSLQPRWRHILIMRVAVRRECAFLYNEHYSQARDAGLSEDEITSLGELPTAPMADPFEAALSRAADEFIDSGVISRTTWSRLSTQFQAAPQQLLDVIFTIGCYVTVAGFMRSVDLEVDRERTIIGSTR
jgi:alkylhydroperoxidase family enzyme